jgi:hypothetical protein
MWVMPEIRMNSMKSEAMNCDPLSQMNREAGRRIWKTRGGWYFQ